MHGFEAMTDQRAMGLAARLASIIARPLDKLDASSCQAGPLAAKELRALAANPAFRRPVNLAVARTLQLNQLALGPADIARLSESPPTRLAVLIVSDEMVRVQEAAQLAAAAILSRRVARLTLKTERDRARELFGSTGFEIATQEIPLNAALADLASDMNAEDPLAPEMPIEEARDTVAGFGMAVLQSFAKSVEPALSRLMALRLPGRGPGSGGTDLRLLDSHCDHLVRLFRRRMRPWAAIIG
jgi:hypothetical protein